jgi:hypothetical protein
MIKEVLIVSKTHLDVGFTNLAAKVRQSYMDNFLDRALAVSEHFRDSDNGRNYIWTVGSWLIAEFLNKLPPEKRSRLDDAIARGDLTWHALPFTMHCELNSEFSFQRALDTSRMLDQRYGRRTTAAKMTDVPGHSRGIVAPLAQAGVKLLHIGINPASAVVDLPETFRWQDARGHSLIVIYHRDYGRKYLLPDGETLVCLDVTGDNLGPRSIAEMEEIYENLESEYPDAAVRCGTLDEVAARLEKHQAALPVFTAEIGDTWIHGVGTDPWKTARFKELGRWRETFGIDPRFTEFDRELLQISEHTWGMDEKTHLPDRENYLGAGLQKLQDSPQGKLFESSWQEQRQLISAAISTLHAPLRQEANDRLEVCAARKPDLAGCQKRGDRAFKTVHFSGRFHVDGALESLKVNGRLDDFASETRRLFSLSGEIFGPEDYERFHRQYNRLDDQWVIDDFTKPGTPAQIKHTVFTPKLLDIYTRQDCSREVFILKLGMESSDQTGMPREIYLTYSFPRERASLDLSLCWFSKYPARIAHALHLSCQPAFSDAAWSFSKMGEPIDVQNVAFQGARSLHAMDPDIMCRQAGNQLVFTSRHAPLVAPGEHKLLDFDNQLPNLDGGIHYNLYNNIWGTNFPMWYGDDTKLDFSLSFDVVR